MYCVIKCVNTKRVLKGSFASSVFHSCSAKTQKTQNLASPVRNVLRYVHITAANCCRHVFVVAAPSMCLIL
jgi:hypothetical protein